MNIEDIRDYCLGFAGVTESFPFGEDTLVFKVMGKMFCLLNIETKEFVNLKCDPVKAIELRELHQAIKPGFHMNKKHWNSVYMDGSLSNAFLQGLIDHSYNLVVQSLPKKDQQQLAK